LERADSEGLNRLSENLVAEVDRSGSYGGFGLELAMATIAMDVKPPRTILCEQKKGLCTVPGDIWLERENIRYEFQCKCSLNLTVEFSVNVAQERIDAATKSDVPGYLYQFLPYDVGDKESWLTFADWVINNYQAWKIGKIYKFSLGGTCLAEISLIAERTESGLIPGLVASPDRLQSNNGEEETVKRVKKTLENGFKEARKSISASPSDTQMNCLVVEFKEMPVEEEDIFSALYGHSMFELVDGKVRNSLVRDGLFYRNRLDFWSAVVFVEINGFCSGSSKATVFPNPRWQKEVVAAFSDFPHTTIYENTC
jgi:hypothetical protein